MCSLFWSQYISPSLWLPFIPGFLPHAARVREMEEEAEKIRQIQSEVDKQMNLGSPPGAAGATSPLNMSLEEKMEVDARSIYVGNVSTLRKC